MAMSLQGHMSSLSLSSAANELAMEMRVLKRTRATDFLIDHTVEQGCDGLVVAAHCTMDGLPDQGKLYAVKMLYTFAEFERSKRVRNMFRNEWELLAQRSHPNVVHLWAEFSDVITDPFYNLISPEIRELAVIQNGPRRGNRCKAQFVVLDHHMHDLEAHRSSYPTPLPVGDAKRFAGDLLEAACFLKKNRIAHLDLKLNNIVVAEDGRLVLIDFGYAKRFSSRDMKVRFEPGMSIGGNQLHLAPEILQRYGDFSRREIRPGEQENMQLDYSGQLAWAVGVLTHELITGEHPLPNYPNQYIGPNKQLYRVEQIAKLPTFYPSAFQAIVCRLLHPSPDLRATIDQGIRVIVNIRDTRSDADALLEQFREEHDQTRATVVAANTETQAAIENLTARVEQYEHLVQQQQQVQQQQLETITSLTARIEQYEEQQQKHEQQQQQVQEKQWGTIASLMSRVVLDRHHYGCVAGPLHEKSWKISHIETANRFYLVKSCLNPDILRYLSDLKDELHPSVVIAKASSDRRSEYTTINTGELAELRIRHSGDGHFCIVFDTVKEWRVSPKELRMAIQLCNNRNVLVKGFKAVFHGSKIFQGDIRLHVETNVATEGDHTLDPILDSYTCAQQSHRSEVYLNLDSLSKYACKAITINLDLKRKEEECKGDFHLHLEALELLGDLMWPLDSPM